MNWLRNAFALDPPGAAEPALEDRDAVDRVCREVVRRQMTVPALMLLEMSRPLNGLAAQILHFFQPCLSVLGTGDAPQRFAEFLERRGSIEYLCTAIERFDREASAPLERGTP